MSNKVALISCSDYKLQEVHDGINKGINLLGGWRNFIKPGEKVFVKLNLLMKKNPEEAVTTHPVIVETVVKQLLEVGAEVTIGDSPGGPFTNRALKSIYKITGMEEVADKTGVSLNWNTEEINKKFPQGKIIKNFNLCKAMLEADKIISISKLKTHQMTKFTGAVKVLFGTVPGLKKAEYHLKMPKLKDFSDMLIDLALCVNPVLNIMDAIVGMEGHGPSAGTPRHVGKILISSNPFALDWVALELVGINPLSVPTLKQAVERNIYPGLKKRDLIGEDIVPLKPPFKAPQISGDVKFPVPGFITEYLRPKPVIDFSNCLRCGECARNCPPQAIIFENKYPEINLEKCIRCFCCQELCPHKAVKVKKSWLSRMLSR